MKPENNTCQASRGFVPSALYSLQKKMKPSCTSEKNVNFLPWGSSHYSLAKRLQNLVPILSGSNLRNPAIGRLIQNLKIAAFSLAGLFLFLVTLKLIASL